MVGHFAQIMALKAGLTGGFTMSRCIWAARRKASHPNGAGGDHHQQ